MAVIGCNPCTVSATTAMTQRCDVVRLAHNDKNNAEITHAGCGPVCRRDGSRSSRNAPDGTPKTEETHSNKIDNTLKLSGSFFLRARKHSTFSQGTAAAAAAVAATNSTTNKINTEPMPN